MKGTSAGTDETTSQRKPLLRRLLLPVACVTLTVLLVQTFAGEILHVRENSMHPTLHGGEDRIFMVHDRTPPGPEERFSVWVFRDSESQGLRIKRLLGLPGEIIDFMAGDLWVGQTRDQLVRVQRSRDLAESMQLFVYRSAESPPGRLVVSSGSLLNLPAGGLALRGGATSGFRSRLVDALLGQEDVRDDSLDAQGRVSPGQHCVGDLTLEFEVRALAEGNWVRLVHALDGEERSLQVSQRGLRVQVRDPEGDDSSLLEGPPPRLPFHGRFQTLDGIFRVQRLADGGSWETLFEGPRDTQSFAGHSRVRLESGPGEARLGILDIMRDVHYFWPPALGEAHQVQKGSVFLAGDNPRSSRDSREDDDVRQAALVGRACAIVWPPSRWRRLAR